MMIPWCVTLSQCKDRYSITNSDLNSPCFAWQPYGKLGLFKTELVIIIFSMGISRLVIMLWINKMVMHWSCTFCSCTKLNSIVINLFLWWGNQTPLSKYGGAIEFYLPVTVVIIPDVLVTNLITKLYQSCLVAMACKTILAGMKFSITGTQNSHGTLLFSQCQWNPWLANICGCKHSLI